MQSQEGNMNEWRGQKWEEQQHKHNEKMANDTQPQAPGAGGSGGHWVSLETLPTLVASTKHQLTLAYGNGGSRCKILREIFLSLKVAKYFAF